MVSRITYEELIKYPKGSKVIVTKDGLEFTYLVHDLTPEFWQFLSEIADVIKDEINDEKTRNEV